MSGMQNTDAKAVNEFDIKEGEVDEVFEALLLEHQAPEAGSENAAPSGLNFSEVEGVHVDGELPQHSQQYPVIDHQEQIDLAAKMIKAGLVFAMKAIGKLDIDDSDFEAISKPWAVVIIKYYPNGIFDFLAQWGDELKAVAATLVFIGVVSKASKEKREREEEAKRQQMQDKRGVSDDSAA